jgi:hypothetical protein
MARHDTEPILKDLGVVELTYKGVVLGKTVTNPEGGTHGGATLRYSEQHVQTMRDVEGQNEHDSILTGQTYEVQVNLTGLSMAQLAGFIPGWTLSSASVVHKQINIGNAIGRSMREEAGLLIVKPVEDGVTVTVQKDWLNMELAYPLPEIEVANDLENQRIYVVTFRALRNLTTGRLGFIGKDTTAT